MPKEPTEGPKRGRPEGFKFPKVHPDELRPLIKDYLKTKAGEKTEREVADLPDGFWTHDDQRKTAVRMLVGKLVRDKGLQVSEITQQHFHDFGMGSALRVFGSKKNALEAALPDLKGLHDTLRVGGFSDKLIKTKPAKYEVRSIQNAVRVIKRVKGPEDIGEDLHNLHLRVFGNSPQRVSYRYLLKLAEEYTGINYRTLYQLFNPKYSRFEDFDKGLQEDIKTIRRQWGLEEDSESGVVKRYRYFPLDRPLLQKREKVSSDDRTIADKFNLDAGAFVKMAALGGLRRGLAVLPLLNPYVRIKLISRLDPTEADYNVSFKKGVSGLTMRERDQLRPYVSSKLLEIFDEAPFGEEEWMAGEDNWDKQRERHRLENQKRIKQWEKELLEEELRKKAADDVKRQLAKKTAEEEKRRGAETRRLMAEKRKQQRKQERTERLRKEREERARQKREYKLAEEARKLAEKEKKRQEIEAQREFEKQQAALRKQEAKRQKLLAKQKEIAEFVEDVLGYIEDSASGDGWEIASKPRADRLPLSFLSRKKGRATKTLTDYLSTMSPEQWDRFNLAADANEKIQARKKAEKEVEKAEQELARQKDRAERQKALEQERLEKQMSDEEREKQRVEKVKAAAAKKANKEAKLMKGLTDVSAPLHFNLWPTPQKIYEFGRTHKLPFRPFELIRWIKQRDATFGDGTVTHNLQTMVGKTGELSKSKVGSVYTFTEKGKRRILLHERLGKKRVPETFSEKVALLMAEGKGYSNRWLLENLLKHYTEEAKKFKNEEEGFPKFLNLIGGYAGGRTSLFKKKGRFYYLNERGIECQKSVASPWEIKEILGEPVERPAASRKEFISTSEEELLERLRAGFKKGNMRFVVDERLILHNRALLMPEVEELALKFLGGNPTVAGLNKLRRKLYTFYTSSNKAAADKVVANAQAQLAERGVVIEKPLVEATVEEGGPTEEDLWAEMKARQKEEEDKKRPPRDDFADEDKPDRAEFGKALPLLSLKDLSPGVQYNIDVQARYFLKQSPSKAVLSLTGFIKATAHCGEADAVRLAKEAIKKETKKKAKK
ncbi:hypothetical protein ACFLQ2_00325 [archaeon]